MKSNVSSAHRSTRLIQSLLLSLVGTAFVAQPTFAAVTWETIQFGGYLSQGYLDSTNNNYPVDTKSGTFDFREYALNASKTFGTHFRMAAQVFGEKLGKYGDDKPILDWALADYNFRPEIGVQVGRLKFPRSMYSDVLDLDVVRPFVFLPQSMYDNRLRDFQASFDGAAVYGSIGAGRSSFDYKVFYGKIPMKTDSGVADFINTTGIFGSTGATAVKEDAVYGTTVTWNTPVAGLRFLGSYSRIKNLDTKGPLGAMPVLAAEIKLVYYDSTAFSAEYTEGPWTFSAEYQFNRFDAAILLPAVIAPPSHSMGQTTCGYVSVARKLGAKFEVGTYFDYTQDDKPSATQVPVLHRRKDWAVAVCYNFNDHLLFKLEGHYIDGAKDFFDVSGISNPSATIKNNMFLFAAKTTLSF